MGTNVILRVSEEEKEAWVEVAGKSGLSSWIRRVCNEACGDEYVPPAATYKPAVVYPALDELADSVPVVHRRESSHKVGCACTLCKIKAGVIKEARVKYA